MGLGLLRSRGFRVRPGLRPTAAVLGGLVALLAPAVSPALEETELKAAFVLRLASFVEWPEEAFAVPDAPLRVAVVGAPSPASALESLASEKRIGGRRVEVVRPPPEGAAGDPKAQVVFLGRAGEDRIAAFLRAAAEQPVVTISDARGFARRGGVFELVRDGTRIRFEVNRATAQR